MANNYNKNDIVAELKAKHDKKKKISTLKGNGYWLYLNKIVEEKGKEKKLNGGSSNEHAHTHTNFDKILASVTQCHHNIEKFWKLIKLV